MKTAAYPRRGNVSTPDTLELRRFFQAKLSPTQEKIHNTRPSKAGAAAGCNLFNPA
ncbi:hypothetical protein [Pseudomonas umsongensis]|jgi:hypothetical protein|uniref:hypothetical protein n=1 Tax=Pseudomonas umsongensis TaxID=198618 RepID=UPI0012EA1951|nr:hypothetical protein [Pseudomonas umsongensis]